MKTTILVINGPNLNFLGVREPDIYGKQDYAALLQLIEAEAAKRDVEVQLFQSNHEGAIIDRIQQAYLDGVQGIVINPGAYTHTSIAILDAAKAVKLPLVEVHISKVEEREAYRQISYIREAAIKTISGEGTKGYFMAIDHLCEVLNKK